MPCADDYWNTVRPIFSNLKVLKGQGLAWHDMENKEEAVYEPIIKAFIDELNRAYECNNTIPSRLISYLLGIRDFYKVVAIDNKQLTEFQSFNRFKPNSKNTAELYLNNGWSLSFRIHNASTIVEPSLKFDIQFLGVPANIITVNCSWR